MLSALFLIWDMIVSTQV